MPAPDRALVDRVFQTIGSHVTSWEPVTKGWTAAERWVARLEDGSSIFVKAAANENTAQWLRTEYANYSRLAGPWMPTVLGWEEFDGPYPILILEDLSHAHWPPPWTPDQIDSVLATHADLRGASHDGLPSLEEIVGEDLRGGWAEVLEDPEPFLSLGLCSARWLDEALPELLAVVQDLELAGDDVLHCDIRSDNVCFDGSRTLFVDWNWACVGRGIVDLAGWAPSLHAEGGPAPWVMVPNEPALAAAMAGYWAARAGLDAPRPGSRVREIQLKQLKEALPWAARELDLPPPGESL